MTRRASRDVQTLYAQLTARSVTAADRWQAALYRTIESLRHLPERCPEAPEAEWFGPGLRETSFGKRRNTYRILFEVSEGEVVVQHVRHGRQDLLRPDPE